MPCYEIEFPLAGLPAETVETVLLEIGACAIGYFDGGEQPVLEPRLGEIRLWGSTLIRAWFSDSCDATASLCTLATRLGPRITAAARLRRVEDRDWERVWLADLKPMRFGDRLWICPSGKETPADPGAVIVRLDPGLAFGTGTHPTTALCLEALDALPLSARSVIDYGCGSGILAIAALKLGASQAIGVDRDPQALLAARENAHRNAVSERLVVQDGQAPLLPADCVLANILAGTLIELAPSLKAACKPGADLVLSGMLAEQADAVIDAYRREFEVVSRAVRDDWSCTRLRHRPAMSFPGAR